jgi:hypothetical protein
MGSARASTEPAECVPPASFFHRVVRIRTPRGASPRHLTSAWSAATHASSVTAAAAATFRRARRCNPERLPQDSHRRLHPPPCPRLHRHHRRRAMVRAAFAGNRFLRVHAPQHRCLASRLPPAFQFTPNNLHPQKGGHAVETAQKFQFEITRLTPRICYGTTRFAWYGTGNKGLRARRFRSILCWYFLCRSLERA